MLDKLSLDSAAMRMQCVKNTIESILSEILEILLEYVAQCRALDPSRHGMLRRRLDQSVKSHGAREGVSTTRNRHGPFRLRDGARW